MNHHPTLAKKPYMLVNLALYSQKKIYTSFLVLRQLVTSKKHVQLNYLCAPKRVIVDVLRM